MKRGQQGREVEGGRDMTMVLFSFDAHQIPTDGHWMQSFFFSCVLMAGLYITWAASS